jgi:hypothetical protein
MRMRALLFATIGIAASFGCTALIGVRDIYLDESGEGGASSSSSSSGNTSSSSGGTGEGGGGVDGGGDCKADLQTDAKNCGRCGRDCLGAACTNGACEPVVLSASLANPSGIFLMPTKVLVTLSGDGRILEIDKNPGGTPRVVTTGRKDPWGLFVDGNTLYFADSDYPQASNPTTYKGGIWSCDLTNCGTPALVISSDHPVNPILHNGVVYFAENNDSAVRRVLPNGTQTFIVDTATQPFGVAADNQHVYYTSAQPQFWRAPLDGGEEEAVGPQDYFRPGFVALDNDRYYYAYSANELAGGGHVLSYPKANPAAPAVEYAAGSNVVPVGVAVDSTYVYWTTWGNVDQVSGLAKADGEVRACPKAGCPAAGPIVLVKGLARAYAIAVDDQAVYFNVYTNSGQTTGSVQKVAKP